MAKLFFYLGVLIASMLSCSQNKGNTGEKPVKEFQKEDPVSLKRPGPFVNRNSTFLRTIKV